MKINFQISNINDLVHCKITIVNNKNKFVDSNRITVKNINFLQNFIRHFNLTNDEKKHLETYKNLTLYSEDNIYLYKNNLGVFIRIKINNRKIPLFIIDYSDNLYFLTSVTNKNSFIFNNIDKVFDHLYENNIILSNIDKQSIINKFMLDKFLN